jgi:AAA15 family ATPase/GTPase
LPYLIQVIEAPGMLIIDEFGNSLHNKLAEKVIRYFMEKAGDSQLFITSQHTNLVSNSLFRPDQIYLTTFQGIMGSMATRLSQFKPREAQNLEKMYPILIHMEMMLSLRSILMELVVVLQIYQVYFHLDLKMVYLECRTNFYHL